MKGARPKKGRRLLLAAGALALALALGGGLFLLSRPRPYWAVEESLVSEWNRILRQAPRSPPFNRVEPIPAGAPQGFGYIISPRLLTERKKPEGQVRIYPWLSRTREWNGALVLAVNPWMIFRKHKDPAPDRNRVASPGGGLGLLICPGRDSAAVFAWNSQLLQDPPGAFPPDPALWEEAGQSLFQNRRFQNGAATFGWVDVWPLLFRENLAWVYAPVNRVRELPAYRMGLLAASRFPEKDEWNEYGVQADLLWAMPFGGEAQKKKLNRAAEWLKNAAVQTEIANTINWVPAHPQGVPYNPVTWEAQVAWINSSFVWQGAEHAPETDQ
jgi:hypothetical protein